MKKYYEFHEEISKENLFKGLLGFGLFAEKIPQFVSSVSFYNFITTKKFPYNDSKPTDYIRYSNMRNINIPRPLSIPEPFSYANQVKLLSENWPKITSHVKKKTRAQKYKVSRIHLRNLKDKESLFEMNYKNFSTDGNPEDEIFIKSKYIAHADIATCFPSIYSHSIAWALVGKSLAKRESGQNYKNKWFNQIDFYTRNLKYGETNGLLIGPHSSNLISELILCCIDNQLLNRKYSFYRNVDDYTCYTNSHEEAEKFFVDLSELLKDFELSLNSKKSKISQLPQASISNWITKLNHFNFTDQYTTPSGTNGLKLKELRGFIDFVIETMLENNNDAAILNYAIKIISNKHLGKIAHDYLINKLHHLTLLYPYLVLILEKYVFEKHKVDQTKIEAISNDLYELGIKKKNYEICSYALYFAVKYNFKLNNINIKRDSLKSSDCIFLMIAYLYDKRNNRKSYLKEYKDLALKLYKEDFHRFWLFCYEVLTQKELKDKYKELKRSGISFIIDSFS
ncbi:RNA-directed DNA polymerase [Elizabethkingia miricola]|uniref:RNA-directed DNA polymerase n=1 Tax=Elizabethkingia miricola TaxID=172045 RepID=UPI003891ACF1